MKQRTRTKRREQGYIEKRGEAKYLVRWRTKDHATGKTKQVSQVVEGDYGEAIGFLSMKLKNTVPAVEKPERTFGDFLDHEWAAYVKENWKISTQHTQGSLVRHHVRPFFEEMLLSKITASEIVAFHAGLEAKLEVGQEDSPPGSFDPGHNVRAHVRRRRYIIARNPIKRRFFKKEKDKPKKPALDEAQLAKLLKALPIRYRAFFTTLSLTGIRSGEALGLQWADVDFATAASFMCGVQSGAGSRKPQKLRIQFAIGRCVRNSISPS